MVAHLLHSQNWSEADVVVGEKLYPFISGLGHHNGSYISLDILLQGRIPLGLNIFGPVQFPAKFSPEFIFDRS